MSRRRKQRKPSRSFLSYKGIRQKTAASHKEIRQSGHKHFFSDPSIWIRSFHSMHPGWSLWCSYSGFCSDFCSGSYSVKHCLYGSPESFLHCLHCYPCSCFPHFHSFLTCSFPPDLSVIVLQPYYFSNFEKYYINCIAFFLLLYYNYPCKKNLPFKKFFLHL